MENELYHYGIKGMKWGVRRFQNKDGSYTPAGKKRRSQEGWSDDAKEAASIKKKSVKQMSNSELRKLNERQNLERQYKQLNPNKIKKGMAVAAGIASGMGTIAALYNNSNQLIKAGKAIMEATMKKSE